MQISKSKLQRNAEVILHEVEGTIEYGDLFARAGWTGQAVHTWCYEVACRIWEDNPVLASKIVRADGTSAMFALWMPQRQEIIDTFTEVLWPTGEKEPVEYDHRVMRSAVRFAALAAIKEFEIQMPEYDIYWPAEFHAG